MFEEIQDGNSKMPEIRNGKPHCPKHWAMNKISRFPEGGGYWRCISSIQEDCRYGCIERKER